LAAATRFREAGDLCCSLETYSFSQAVEFYNKGGCFLKAIREAMKEKNLDSQKTLLNQTKNSINLAYDVKKNQILKILEDFDKRYLRLKIVQNNKKCMPSAMDVLNKQGIGFDADQMSMSGTSSYSESQQSSTSGRSSASGFSITSK
jgi:hypothetical protein